MSSTSPGCARSTACAGPGVLEAFRTSPFAGRIYHLRAGSGAPLSAAPGHRLQPDEALRRRAEALGVRLGFLVRVRRRCPTRPTPTPWSSITPALPRTALPEAVELLAQVFQED